MKFSVISQLAIAIAALCPVPTIAETTAWKSIGWWDIDFYSSGKGCSAYSQFEGGTDFFIGLTGEDPLLLEILIGNKKWKSIEAGKEYNVGAKFGDEVPWNLSMDGISTGEFTALRLRVDAQAEKSGVLVDEFMREVSMVWTYDGNRLGHFSLKNSGGAFEEAVKCTKSYRSAVSNSSDPFSGSSENGDPFE